MKRLSDHGSETTKSAHLSSSPLRNNTTESSATSKVEGIACEERRGNDDMILMHAKLILGQKSIEVPLHENLASK
jgi:hypothetical protein